MSNQNAGGFGGGKGFNLQDVIGLFMRGLGRGQTSGDGSPLGGDVSGSMGGGDDDTCPCPNCTLRRSLFGGGDPFARPVSACKLTSVPGTGFVASTTLRDPLPSSPLNPMEALNDLLGALQYLPGMQERSGRLVAALPQLPETLTGWKNAPGLDGFIDEVNWIARLIDKACTQYADDADNLRGYPEAKAAVTTLLDVLSKLKALPADTSRPLTTAAKVLFIGPAELAQEFDSKLQAFVAEQQLRLTLRYYLGKGFKVEGLDNYAPVLTSPDFRLKLSLADSFLQYGMDAEAIVREEAAAFPDSIVATADLEDEFEDDDFDDDLLDDDVRIADASGIPADATMPAPPIDDVPGTNPQS